MIIDTLNKDTHYFTLDLHEGAILSEPLNFKQYDERSRELAVELTVHNKPLDLSNARVDIWVYKKDGHTVMKPAEKENIDLDNSIVLIPLTRQMLILPPSVECEIVVTYADKRVLSFPIFEVTIERSNVDMDTVVSTSEFQLFYDALYRMEQWMRDYLDKYATIDQAFTTKLAALTLALQTVNAEWEQLKLKLSQDNQTNFNTFKQEQTAEMKKFYNQYHKFYTEQCIAIQEKLNTLQADIEHLEAESERILKESQDNSNIIKALKEQCQTLHEQITQIKTDADAKLTEMTKRFAEMEEEFTNNEAERQATFVNNESNLENPNSRQSVFNTNEAQRQATFNNNESNLENPNSRQSVFVANEEARQATFNTNEITGENSRQKVFERNEETRQSTFDTSQTERTGKFKTEQEQREYAFNNAQTARDKTFKANETTRQTNEDARVIAETARATAETGRVSAEETRVSEFEQMKQDFNTFLQYRYIEE